MFGKSLFESVLSRVEAEREEEEARPQSSARIRGFSSGFVMEAMEGISVSLARPDDAYFAFDGHQPPAPAPPSQPQPDVAPSAPPEGPPDIPPMPPGLSRQLPREIAEDLTLSPHDSIAVLQEKRRSFARANHPDVIHPAYRALATTRMMTANLLIDTEIHKIEAMRARGIKTP